MEEDFPRGGREEAREQHKKQKEAEEDVPYFVQKKRQKRALEEAAEGDGAVIKKADDYLFGSSSSSSKRKSKKHKKQSGGDNDNDPNNNNKHSLLPLGGGGVIYKKNTGATKSSGGTNTVVEPYIEALGFSRMAKGTKLLGIVREVQEEFALVSLPNLLTGYVLRSEMGKTAPPLTHTVSVGQVLAVVILKTVTETVAGASKKKGPGTRRRIQVSLEPTAVNPRHEEPTAKFPLRGKIQGVEDNGVLVDLGHGRKGFLAFEDMDENSYMVKEEEDDEDDDMDDNKDDEDDDGMVVLKVGQLHDFIVKRKAKSAADIIPLKLPSPDLMAKHAIPSSDATPSIQAISPGWLVKAKVEALARNGLCVAFLNNVFRGAVELAHLGGFWIPTTKQSDGSTDWKALFRATTTNGGEKQPQQSSSPIIVSFTARILAVDPATKMVRLTVLPHLMDMRPPPNSYLPSPGTVVQDATVVRLDPGVGALLALPSSTAQGEEEEKDTADKMDVDDNDDDNEDDKDNDDEEEMNDNNAAVSLLHEPLSESRTYRNATKVRAVYIHISKAMDETEDGKIPEATFAKAFAPSTKHNVRILSTSNLVESVASGAAASSIINAHVLTHADLTPGKIFRKVPVCAHLNGGAVLVEFGMEVRGLLTVDHLFDQAGGSEQHDKMLKSKFAVGAKVDVRVLFTDPAAKRCFVTAKKSLLQASDIIDDWNTCKEGSLATGFISRIDDQNMYVTFFNRVYGRVSAKSLALELGIDDHRANYQVGHVVRCRVAAVKRKRRGMQRTSHQDSNDEDDEAGLGRKKEIILSLRVNADDANKGDEQTQKKVQLRVGSLLPDKAMKVVELVSGKQKDNGTFVPGHAIVRVKSKYLVDEAERATMLPYVECKLPFDELKDHYEESDRESSVTMDDLAEQLLKPGKSVKQKGILLSNPRKSRLAVVSIRPKLVANAEKRGKSGSSTPDRVVIPGPDFGLYDGATVMGVVSHIDRRYGAFLRFLDGLTGLVPKVNGGVDLELFGTVTARVASIDNSHSPPRFVLSLPKSPAKGAKRLETHQDRADKQHKIRHGDTIEEAEIETLDFYNATLKIVDSAFKGLQVKARIHCTMAVSENFKPSEKKIKAKYSTATAITKYHPFHGWTQGDKLRNLHVASVHVKDAVYYVDLTNQKLETEAPDAIPRRAHMQAGQHVSAIVRQVAKFNGGLFVALSPKLSGFIPGLECSTNADILNDLERHFPIGARLSCTVIDENHHLNKHKTRTSAAARLTQKDDAHQVCLSLILEPTRAKGGKAPSVLKPSRGDLVVGRIQRTLKQVNAPSLMLELRGGCVGRCCITELEEMDEWTNMPLGHAGSGGEGKEVAIVSGESDGEEDASSGNSRSSFGSFPNGKYVACRVLEDSAASRMVDVSLRSSRTEGDVEEDEIPEEGEMCHAYVVVTNKSGCFVRLSRTIQGRVMIKELSDDFLPNPAAAFPPGRLVAGKIKAVKEVTRKKEKKTTVDLDMRESTMIENEELQFADVEVQSKHTGTVTRVEDYGVFVRLNNSKVSGLVHRSECSDSFIKSPVKMYDPGDLVKVLVVRKNQEEKKISFSMKASHFADDEDSDDESIGDGSSGDDRDEDTEMREPNEPSGVDSDDPDYTANLAKSLSGSKKKALSDDSSSSSDSDDNEEASDSESDDDEDNKEKSTKTNDDHMMDTDVGFDWSTHASKVAESRADESDSASDDGDSDEDDDALAASTSHKSRKKQAKKRREEQEISRRETALADGTADDNPETAADFERLLSGSPNSSEIWIRYMAFHLALVDIPSARSVAERAFARIEFSQEREKLNVWCALLALELKYGSASTLQAVIDRACQQNNPKKVYLRVCEMLAKEVNASSPETVLQADEMFAKMCKKFKSKKQVWIAHLQYLLQGGRHKEAHDLLRRSLKSLPEYKHVETMSKFAQLEFEHGSAERARTVFDGVILKHPKRLDLVFVYADKEVKHGSMQMARALFEKIVSPRDEASPKKSKLSDKQMKSLFKKWYKLEEEHGTTETQEHVKETAKAFVNRS